MSAIDIINYFLSTGMALKRRDDGYILRIYIVLDMGYIDDIGSPIGVQNGVRPLYGRIN